jgi:chromosome segregation ATPase
MNEHFTNPAEIKESIRSLRIECEVAANDLTALYEKQKEVKRQVALDEKKIADKYLALEKEESEANKRRQFIEDEATKTAKETARASASLAGIVREESRKSAVLSKVNDWILKAEERKAELENEIREAIIAAKTKVELQAKVASLSKEISDLQTAHSKAGGDMGDMMVKARYDLNVITKAVREAEVSLERIRFEAEMAENKKNLFEREYLKKKNDLDIYQQRVVDEYKKVFPNRAVKI